MDDGGIDRVTLGSEAACSIWLYGRHAGSADMTEKEKRIRMVDANETPITHYGQKRVCFKGAKASEWGFGRRV